MQIVSGDNLHEMSDPVFWKKIRKNIINLSSAELAQRVLNVERDLKYQIINSLFR